MEQYALYVMDGFRLGRWLRLAVWGTVDVGGGGGGVFHVLTVKEYIGRMKEGQIGMFYVACERRNGTLTFFSTSREGSLPPCCDSSSEVWFMS